MLTDPTVSWIVVRVSFSQMSPQVGFHGCAAIDSGYLRLVRMSPRMTLSEGLSASMR